MATFSMNQQFQFHFPAIHITNTHPITLNMLHATNISPPVSQSVSQSCLMPTPPDEVSVTRVSIALSQTSLTYCMLKVTGFYHPLRYFTAGDDASLTVVWTSASFLILVKVTSSRSRGWNYGYMTILFRFND